jgi:hypothetical protein
MNAQTLKNIRDERIAEEARVAAIRKAQREQREREWLAKRPERVQTELDAILAQAKDKASKGLSKLEYRLVHLECVAKLRGLGFSVRLTTVRQEITEIDNYEMGTYTHTGKYEDVHTITVEW